MLISFKDTPFIASCKLQPAVLLPFKLLAFEFGNIAFVHSFISFIPFILVNSEKLKSFLLFLSEHVKL